MAFARPDKNGGVPHAVAAASWLFLAIGAAFLRMARA